MRRLIRALGIESGSPAVDLSVERVLTIQQCNSIRIPMNNMERMQALLSPLRLHRFLEIASVAPDDCELDLFKRWIY